MSGTGSALAPLDFQSERRSFLDAKDAYLHMTPLLFANNLTGALLLYAARPVEALVGVAGQVRENPTKKDKTVS